MAAVQPIRQQSYEQIYALLQQAVLVKSCLSARYRGYRRLLCPYVLGRNNSDEHRVLAYQYGGSSASGLEYVGSPNNWRCIALEKLSDVSLIEDEWVEAPNQGAPQTCIATIELMAGDDRRAAHSPASTENS